MAKGSGKCNRPSLCLGEKKTVQAIKGLIEEPLLSRQVWHDQVFKRSVGKCVVCGENAADAHHLVERKLFEDGGYYYSNGVALCSEHHLDAEGCKILPAELREQAGLTTTVLPAQAATDDEYDKWLNPIDSKGVRHVGPLFFEEQCQKALKKSGTLGLYERRVKYPRTAHLSWSPGKSADDLSFDNEKFFEGKQVVVTAKMDGENTTIGQDYVHARSVDSKYHPSRTWVNSLAAEVGHQLPAGWRVSGENLQAKHSIGYDNLPSYFLVFSIWDEQNRCLSWQETNEWCELLDLKPVPQIYSGIWDKEKIQSSFEQYQSPWSKTSEGYVVRTSESFSYKDFKQSLAKWVRKDHVQTDQHWSHAQMQSNGIEKTV